MLFLVLENDILGFFDFIHIKQLLGFNSQKN